MSGYAAFEAGKLVRAVFVNLHAWLASSTGARPVVHVDLDFARAANATQADVDAFWGGGVQARRLVIGHADDVANLTWAGQSYEQTDVLDSSLCIMPLVFFATPAEPRFLSTLKRIMLTPERGGLTSNVRSFRLQASFE